MLEHHHAFQDRRLRLFIGDVRDGPRLADAMHGCDAVIHTAALKYVSGAVLNPGELVKTNVIGTINVIQAAAECGVPKVVVITSDKGAGAVNMYGATKFLAESYAVAQNAVTFPQGTRVACVRFGNLLWSRGSVAHRFRGAIQAGRIPEITHLGMTRFGIGLPDAADVIGRVLNVMRGGEVFVPDLWAFTIVGLAEVAWQQWAPTDSLGTSASEAFLTKGLRRGGERLYEILLTPEEASRAVCVDVLGLLPVYVIEPHMRSWDRPAWEGDVPLEGTTLRSDTAAPMSPEDIATSFKWMDEGLISA